VGVAVEIVPLGGVAAQLNMASSAAIEQRMKPKKMRGLKAPDSEEEFFRIGFCGGWTKPSGPESSLEPATLRGTVYWDQYVFESRRSDWMFIFF
jgi:hypothetical protein